MNSDKALESAARAQIYMVMVKPGEFRSDDTYRIMEAPACVVQVGGDFDDDHAANKRCAELNLRAAIAAYLRNVTVGKGMESAWQDAVIEGASFVGEMERVFRVAADELEAGHG